MSLKFINGKIFTLDQKNTVVQALVTEGPLITRTGSNQEIQDLDIEVEQTIDLHGKVVLPGFIDGHAHLSQLALEALWVDLSKTNSKDQVLTLLEQQKGKTSTGKWVVGVNYDDANWGPDVKLSIEDLNSISDQHPVFARRVCGHYAVVNSRALDLIDDSWDNVDRETGILVEEAVLGFMKIVKPDLELRLRGTIDMMPKLHSMGITGVREIVNFHSIKTYNQIDSVNQLKIRVFGYIIIDDLEDVLNEYPKGIPKGNKFNIVGIKLFLDGSLGAHTAALLEPYADEPKEMGISLYSNDDLKTILKRALELDMALMVHAIGDRAVQQFIKVYSEVYFNQIPDNPKGHSLEHVEIVNSQLIKKLKELGIWVSAQPNFAGRWSVPDGLNETRLGPERLKRCNPYKWFIENDIKLIFGSDSMPLGPLFGIKSAIFHPVKEQRISPNDAIKAYTHNCYDLLNKKAYFGSLEPGKIADMVILDQDPYITIETDFDDIKVVGLVFNGDLVLLM